MKVADVCEFYSGSGGGVRSYVDRKLAFAARHGHEVTVIAPGPESRSEMRPGGKIAWIAAPYLPVDRSYRMFWNAADVWRVLDAEAPDLVEGSSPWRGGWIAARWPGRAARALVFHQDFVAGYPQTFLGGVMAPASIDRLFTPYWRYLKALSAGFDATVTGGAWLARRLEQFGSHRPIAVPFGVESGRFSPARRDEALRRELLARCGLRADAKLLLAVGRLHPEKRHRTIIEGVERARAARPLGLVVIGDGLRRAAVEALARRAGNMHLTGAITDREYLAACYASADALVHGSGAETYGFAVAEAILSGLPVVVPDRGGAADLAPHGRSRVYRTGDAPSCAAAILAVLDDGRPVPTPSGIAALDDHFAALFALYRDLAAARAAR